MKWNKTIKKCIAFALAGGIFLASPNSFEVSAAGSPDKISANKPTYGVVKVESGTLNVRQSATVDSDVVASLTNGSYIMIVGYTEDPDDYRSGFYKVQYNTSGNYGYVAKRYVDYMGNYVDSYLLVKPISGNLNMRSASNTASSIVASLPANKAFAYCGTVTDWFFSTYGNTKGYVSQAYVTKMPY